MKNILMIILAITSLNLFAQVEKPTKKGNIMLGGGLNFEYQSQSNYTASSLIVQPTIGYFLADNLALGVTPMFEYLQSKSTTWTTLTTKSTGLGIGPYLRYYSNSGIYLQAGFGYAKFSSDGNQSQTSFYLEPALGYAYFINQNVSLDIKLSYEYTTDNANSSTSHNSALLLGIGFQVFL